MRLARELPPARDLTPEERSRLLTESRAWRDAVDAHARLVERWPDERIVARVP